MKELYDNIHLAILRSQLKTDILRNKDAFSREILPLLDKSKAFDAEFLNLINKNIYDYLIQSKIEDEHTLLIQSYRTLFENEELTEETKEIIKEHIRFIIYELKFHTMILFESAPSKAEMFYTTMVSILNSFIRKNGTASLKDTEKVSSFFMEASGYTMNDDIPDFCFFLDCLQTNEIDYQYDWFFFQILYKSLRECEKEYEPVMNQYENMLDQYVHMIEKHIDYDYSDDEEEVDDNYEVCYEENADSEASNENDEANFNRMLGEVQNYLKYGDIVKAFRILNYLLGKYPKYSDDIYLNLAICYAKKQDFITALYKIEQALNISPENDFLHRCKSRYLSKTGNFLDAMEEGLLAIKLCKTEKYIEPWSLELLKLSEAYFQRFSIYGVNLYDYAKTINCLQGLSELKVAPKNIRDKYKTYSLELISDLEKKLIDVVKAIVDIYDIFILNPKEYLKKCLKFLNLYLSVDNISKKKIESVLKSYSSIKIEIQESFDYLMEEKDYIEIENFINKFDFSKSEEQAVN